MKIIKATLDLRINDDEFTGILSPQKILFDIMLDKIYFIKFIFMNLTAQN